MLNAKLGWTNSRQQTYYNRTCKKCDYVWTFSTLEDALREIDRGRCIQDGVESIRCPLGKVVSVIVPYPSQMRRQLIQQTLLDDPNAIYKLRHGSE